MKFRRSQGPRINTRNGISEPLINPGREIKESDVFPGDRVIIATDNNIYGFRVDRVSKVDGLCILDGGLGKLVEDENGSRVTDPTGFENIGDRDDEGLVLCSTQLNGPLGFIAVDKMAIFFPLESDHGGNTAFIRTTSIGQLAIQRAVL